METGNSDVTGRLDFCIVAMCFGWKVWLRGQGLLGYYLQNRGNGNVDAGVVARCLGDGG